MEQKMKITKKRLQELVRYSIQEYVVPMGYSLKQWKKKKKKEKISNKDYAEKTKGDKWKVVHGKKRGKVGKPVNKSAKNLSYAKATRMHTAIELNESLMKDVNNPKRKQLLGKVLFTEYGYAIFQPFLAPILTSVFGPYIPPVDIPPHHRAETDQEWILTKVPAFCEYLGYSLCPGTTLFGPWVPYKEYLALFKDPRWVTFLLHYLELNFLQVLVASRNF